MLHTEQIKILPWWDKHDDRDYFSLTWNFTRHCNYQCPFCPFFDIDGELPTFETVQAISKWIVDHYPRNRKYSRINIFGGEPTLACSELYMALDMIATVPQEILLYTNLSAPLVQYVTLLSKHKNLFIVGSYYAHTDPTGAVLEKLAQLATCAPDRVAVTLMASHENYAELKSKLEAVGCIAQDSCIEWDTQHVHKKRHTYKQNDQPEIVDTTVVGNDNYQDILNHKDDRGHHNQFYRWTCLAGSNSLYLEANGDLFPCRCYGQYHHMHLKRKLPEKDIAKFRRITNVIADPTFSMGNESATICEIEKHCFDAQITKIKPLPLAGSALS